MEDADEDGDEDRDGTGMMAVKGKYAHCIGHGTNNFPT